MTKQLPQLSDFYYTRAMLENGTTCPVGSGAIIPFDKPLDWTSFDLVNKLRNPLRRLTGIRKIKVGHAGTLDPKATGVLVICTGRCTKQIESLMGQQKEYVATLRLGATTPSFDTEHNIDHYYPYQHITSAHIEQVLPQFIGTIEQIPPLFSATYVQGKRAYDLARQGVDLQLQPKQVQVYNIEIEDVSLPTLRLRIRCGRGTYIRSLARDLGTALGSGAFLQALERVSVGDFSIQECIKVTEIAQLLDLIERVETEDKNKTTIL